MSTSTDSSPEEQLLVVGRHDPHRLERRPIDSLIRPLELLAHNRIASTLLLLIAALAATIVGNSPAAEAWDRVLHLPVGLTLGEARLERSILHWINEGLMGIFFFLVGLEIKREVRTGELSTLRTAIVPVIAAAGGMVVPALLYLAFNPYAKAQWGWGIPVATDIAFALGLLALAGKQVPHSLRVFLTALAIADDIGAVLIIALFYTDAVALINLGVAAALLSLSILMNRLRVRSALAFLAVGLGVWLAFLGSGVHATVAALLMAFTIPSRIYIAREDFERDVQGKLARLQEVGPPTRSLNSEEQHDVLVNMTTTVVQATPPLQRIEHTINPLVALVVLPFFALANAAVSIPTNFAEAYTHPVTLGVIAGLLVGKPIGIVVFTWVATRIGVAELPSGIRFRHVAGVGLLAGIGFTMSIFIAGLAFEEPDLLEKAKLGILSASLVAGAAGVLWLRLGEKLASRRI